MSIKKEDLKKEVIELYTSTGKGTDEIAEKLRLKYDIDLSVSTLGRKFRTWVEKAGISRGKKIEDAKEFKEAQKREINRNKKAYFFTCAQNATSVDTSALKSMEVYAKYRDAEIVVIPLRYKNPTSVANDTKPNTNWWDKNVHKYLAAKRYKINKRLTVLADVKTQPTASSPLSSMEGLTEGESAVIGHPRQHFKTLHTLEEYDNKYLFTTGCITVPNYTDSKAGKRGEFNHTTGFVIVEVDGDNIYPRHVSISEDGTFYDLDYYVTPHSCEKVSGNVLALVGGDIHVGSTDPQIHDVTISMLKRFNPKNYICHDLCDGYSINPHEKRDPFLAAKRELDNSWDFQKEIKEVISYLREVLEWNPIIVKSNHDIFIDRFLVDSDWRKENNKNSYLRYAYFRSTGVINNGVVPYEIEKEFKGLVKCLTEDSSFIVAGNELGQHGHLGAGGSKGSPLQYKRLNIKTITGHTHSPSLEDGNMVVGTQTYKRLGYTKGLNSWANSNAIVHKNGKRQNLIIENNKYTNFK